MTDPIRECMTFQSTRISAWPGLPLSLPVNRRKIAVTGPMVNLFFPLPENSRQNGLKHPDREFFLDMFESVFKMSI